MSKPVKGRPKFDFLRNYFQWEETSGKSICLIKKCGKALKGNHAGNLTKHIQGYHPDETLILGMKHAEMKILSEPAEEKAQASVSHLGKRKNKCVSVDIDKKKLKLACCEMVTVNGRPFSILEDSGFRKIIDPIITALNKSTPDANFNINRQNIKFEVKDTAKNLRETIKQEVKGNLICLKVDTATRLDRSLIGVNIQYVKDGNIILRNLAVKELFVTHTAANLKDEIIEVLKLFDINLDMIYSCTTDNAANVIKTVHLLDNQSSVKCNCPVFKYKEQKPQNDKSDESSTESEAEITEDRNRRSEDEDSDYINTSRSNPIGLCPECHLLSDTLEDINVFSIRCAAHTLQLCIADMLKSTPTIGPIIAKARKLCKYLRTPTISKILKENDLAKPCLDVPTRWHSMFDMLLSLLKLKDMCKKLEEKQSNTKTKTRKQKNNAVLNLNEDFWEYLEDISAALKPAKVATKVLQSSQLTVGDFYDTWLRCKIETAKQNSIIASNVVKFMNQREETLLNSPAIVMGLFMDPRYRILLSNDQILQAKNDLEKLWARLQKLKNRNTITSDIVEENSSNFDYDQNKKSTDPVEFLLLEKEKQKEQVNLQGQNISIQELLVQYSMWTRVDKDTDILMFWQGKKYSDNELYQLAISTLSLPMTQVSVERTFSHLRQIMSILRFNLSPESISDILFVRCNHYLKD